MKLEWLSKIREEKGLSQEVTADKAGITRQYYGMIENGTRQPSVDVAKNISGVLGFQWTKFF